eukprot:gene24131-9711_t
MGLQVRRQHRGVAEQQEKLRRSRDLKIGSQLGNNDIANLPIPALQNNGFLFVWVINAKYKWTLDLFDQWGYK